MAGLGALDTAKVGHMREPSRLEELICSKYITFMERSLPAVFDSTRDFGLTLSNTLFDQPMTWVDDTTLGRQAGFGGYVNLEPANLDNYVYADSKSTGVGADLTRTKGTVHAFQTRVQIEF